MFQLKNFKSNIIIIITIFLIMNMAIINGLRSNNVNNNKNASSYRHHSRNYHYNNNQNYTERNLRPPSYNDSNERNVEKILLIFSGTCAPTEYDVELAVTELLSTYSCLSIWISKANPDLNGIYKQTNGDYKTYFEVKQAQNETSSCIDNINIDFEHYCIKVLDYEVMLTHQSCINNGCYDYPDTTDYRWHRDKIDNHVDSNYTHLDTSSRDSVDVYVLDTGVYWTHYEFSHLKSFTLLDPSYDLSQIVVGHGTHVAGIIVGRTSGISNHALFDYPVCRGESGSCYSSYIDDAISVIIARANRTKRRGVINMSFASSIASIITDLPAYLQSYTNDTFATLIQNGIIPVGAAGNSGMDACNSWPSSSPYVIGVGAYDTNFAVPSWSNYGPCVDIYAPGSGVLSSWITSNYTYRYASGTSMATPVVTALIADMLWHDNSLSFTEIIAKLKSSSSNTGLTSCLSSTSPCNGIKIDCPSFYSLAAQAPSITSSPTTAPPTTASPTTASPTTASPTTASPTTPSPTTASPTTASPTAVFSTTASPTSTDCRAEDVACTSYSQCCSKNCVRRVCV